ncbi:MAG: insulinase family protein, partial [Thermoanaerobaculia bacterium]|nr:insulinase family protein [Thermoanaerobaculia bacterium]
LFAALPPAERSPSLPEPAGGSSSVEEIVVPGGEQAHLYVGQLTVPAGHADVPALQIAAVALGSGPGLVGRIPARIRERDGLAYGAGATTVGGAGRLPGRLVVHVATAPRRVESALAAVRQELEHFVAGGITQQELEEARTYLLGSEPFRRESARQMAAVGGRAMLYGVDWDEPGWLEKALGGLERADVDRAVRRHLDLDRLSVTVGRPAGGA